MGDRVATYTFAGVTPGWYRVAVTWVPGPNGATDAQFRVLDGATPATIMTPNPKLHPPT